MQLNQLISSCKEKDRQAQKELVNRFGPFLYAICRRYLKTEADAQDILQESLVQILNNIHTFKSEPANFKAWIRKITVNQALTKLRKSYVKLESYPGDIPEHRISPAQVTEKLQEQDILNLLNLLPELQRQVFNLSIIDGYKHHEIAEVLKIKESYSRTILNRARKAMQVYITKSNKVRS